MPQCIFCLKTFGRTKRGEHLIQEALGGAKTNSVVCPKCNGDTSPFDQELCSRSPLSLVVADVFDKNVTSTWDVDRSSGNILLDAAPDFKSESLSVFPQFVLDDGEPSLRCAYEPMMEYGFEKFQKDLLRLVRRAVSRKTSNRLMFKSIDEAAERNGRYRYPPRVFASCMPQELSDTTTLTLGYVRDQDKWDLLEYVKNWKDGRRFRSSKKVRGSADPAMQVCWDIQKCERALTKIALNLLHDVCERTKVSRETFPQAVRVVLGDGDIHPTHVLSMGFVEASDVGQFSHRDGGHLFVLQHLDGFWHCISSFFGGRVGAIVVFPGPNDEDWSRCTVATNLRHPTWSDEDDWIVSKSNLFVAPTLKVSNDLSRIVPSLCVSTTQTTLTIEKA